MADTEALLESIAKSLAVMANSFAKQDGVNESFAEVLGNQRRIVTASEEQLRQAAEHQAQCRKDREQWAAAYRELSERVVKLEQRGEPWQG